MDHYVFPTRLFNPTSLQIRLIGAALVGPASISGEGQFADMSGGGRWFADFGETNLWTPAKVKAWRRMAAACDGGATPLLVPLADRRNQPLTNPLVTPDSFGLSTWDDGTTPWAPDQVTAMLSVNADLGSTEITFTYSGPMALEGGEHFSVQHPDWGWRLYRITRVKSGGVGSGDTTVCDIRPPLREAMTTGDSPTPYLNFDSPRCLMRADGDIDLSLDMIRFGKATARFIEAGKPA